MARAEGGRSGYTRHRGLGADGRSSCPNARAACKDQGAEATLPASPTSWRAPTWPWAPRMDVGGHKVFPPTRPAALARATRPPSWLAEAPGGPAFLPSVATLGDHRSATALDSERSFSRAMVPSVAWVAFYDSPPLGRQ